MKFLCNYIRESASVPRISSDNPSITGEPLSREDRESIELRVRSTHSWLYWAVWRTPVFYRFLVGTTVLLAVLIYFAIASFNPTLPFSPGWNVIDRLHDPRIFRDYTSGILTSMAVSERQIAVGTENDGLVLLPVRGSYPRNALTDSGVLDVSAGVVPDTFLALQQNQKISKVDSSGLTIDTTTLIDKPSQLYWPGIKTFSPNNVMLAKLDKKGLLLVVSGVGVARYLMDANGRKRKRSWETTPWLATAHLEHTALSGDGLWVTNQDSTKFIQLDSLAEVDNRTLNSGKVIQLDVDRKGAWASVVNTKNQVYFYNDKAWAGPWFTQPRKADFLQNSKDIILARQQHDTIWIATSNNIFTYHEPSHTMQLLLEDAASAEIESVANGTLVASSAGVHLKSFGGPQTASIAKLDDSPASELRVSPSGDTVVYKTKGTGNYKGAVQPFTNGHLLTAANGWKTSMPEIVGVSSVGKAVMFATSNGCLLYDSEKTIYRDCSKVEAIDKRPERNAESFTAFEEENGRLLAVADGIPLEFQISSETWRPLDSKFNETIDGITLAGDSTFGLSGDGSLYKFHEGTPTAHISKGYAPSFASGNEFIGDVQGDSDDWTLALANESYWASYSSRLGTIEEHKVPGVIQQIRIHESAPLLVMEDGSVADANERSVYGSGVLPFAPTKATALASGVGNSVLVGSSNGQIARYLWKNGSWDTLPPPPMKPQDAVIRIFEDTSTVWVTDGDAVHRLVEDKWETCSGYSTWFVEQPSARMWVGGKSGVLLETRNEKGWSVTKNYSHGEGMREFLPNVKYVWQLDPDRVALFGTNGVGVFDRSTDSWSMKVKYELSQQAVFLPADDFLVVIDGTSMRRFSRSLESIKIQDFPRQSDPSIYVESKKAKAIYIKDKAVHLFMWENMASELAKEYVIHDGTIIDAYIDLHGRIWLLRLGEVLLAQVEGASLLIKGKRFKVPNGFTTLDALQHSVAENGLLPSQNTPPSFATLEYGDEKLDWFAGTQGGSISWRAKSDIPVWCTDENRLSVQCVRGLARSGNLLLVETDFGVLRRALSDYSLKGAEANSQQPKTQKSKTVKSGPYSFSLESDRLVVDNNGRDLTWEAKYRGWRISEDAALRIVRSLEGNLLLSTTGGDWLWTPDRGRKSTTARPILEEYSVKTPVLNILYHNGWVSLSAFDNKSPFQQGRLFYDVMSSIQGFDGALYSLVPNRCVVRRDPQNPGRVTGAWVLPSNDSGYLARGKRGVRYMSESREWELEQDIWKLTKNVLDNAKTGLVSWRRRGSRIAPYLGDKLLEQWWSDDRFTWDKVLAAGALDKGAALLVTPLGIVVKRMSAKGWAPETMVLKSGLDECEQIRRGDAIIGMLVGDEVITDANSQGIQRRAAVAEDVTLIPHVIIDWINDAQIGRRIGFRGEWRKQGMGQVFETPLSILHKKDIIEEGRFFFDRVAAIGRISSDQWVAAAGCDNASCLGILYQNRDKSLIIRDIVPIPIQVNSIRSSTAGKIYGRAGESFVELKLENGGLHARSVQDSSDAFYEGDSVTLDVVGLNWNATPRYGTRGHSFVVTPAEYPVMTSAKEGSTFSFDILRSIATIPDASQIALASLGGIFLCPITQNPFDLSVCKLMYGDDEQLWGKGVSRVRISKGHLWAAFGGGQTRVYDKGEWIKVSSPAPWERIETSAGQIQLKKHGVIVGEQFYKRSNDSWGIGVRPIDGIVDMAWDPRSGYAWLCSREHGIFKLRLSQLHDDGFASLSGNH